MERSKIGLTPCVDAFAVVVMWAVAATTLSGCGVMRDLFPEAMDGTRLEAREVRRVAVLPFAYRGQSDALECTLCPEAVNMRTTSARDAGLVTAFFYEALTRYPGFDVVPYDAVKRFESRGTADAVAHLTTSENVDGILVGAVLDLRPRLGDPRNPHSRAGAALYAALIDPDTGQAFWSTVYDETQQEPGRLRAGFRSLVSGDETRWLTAQGVAQQGAIAMIKDLAKNVD